MSPEEAANRALDAAEALWGVVANVSGGDWRHQSAEWQQAAERARSLYHAAIGVKSEKRVHICGDPNEACDVSCMPEPKCAALFAGDGGQAVHQCIRWRHDDDLHVSKHGFEWTKTGE